MRHVVRTGEPSGIDHIWCGVTLNILLEWMEENWHDDFTHECTPAASTWVRVVMIYNFCCVEGVGKVLLSYQRCDGWPFFSIGRSSLSGTYLCWYSSVQVSGLEDTVSGVPGVTMVAFTSGSCCMLRLKETGAELKRTSSEGIYVRVFFYWVLCWHMAGRGVIEGEVPISIQVLTKNSGFPGAPAFPGSVPGIPVFISHWMLNATATEYCYYIFCSFIWHEIKKTSVFFFSHKQHTHCIK